VSDPIIAAENLQMTFASGESELEALAEATFTVERNEFVCVIGPSGCGKSTLLRILAGLVKPTKGRVLYDGVPLDGPQRHIGFVFQQSNLMPWRTALRNVSLPLEIAGVGGQQASERAMEQLRAVGLAEFAQALPRDLSGGMSQRVAVARALVYDPDVLLLDEPFGALDALTRERMSWELLRLWRRRLKTVIMVTHNIDEAILLSDRVLTMGPRPGRIECELPIDLPRPRSRDDIYSQSFVSYARQLRGCLR